MSGALPHINDICVAHAFSPQAKTIAVNQKCVVRRVRVSYPDANNVLHRKRIVIKVTARETALDALSLHDNDNDIDRDINNDTNNSGINDDGGIGDHPEFLNARGRLQRDVCAETADSSSVGDDSDYARSPPGPRAVRMPLYSRLRKGSSPTTSPLRAVRRTGRDEDDVFVPGGGHRPREAEEDGDGNGEVLSAACFEQCESVESCAGGEAVGVAGSSPVGAEEGGGGPVEGLVAPGDSTRERARSHTSSGTTGNNIWHRILREAEIEFPESEDALRAEIGDDDDALRAVREIWLQSTIRHPNVIAVHCAGLTPSSVWCGLEYAASGDLHNYVMRMGKLDEATAAMILWQLVCAVYACHEQGIVHRDIKPENIFLSKSKNLKLGDFGMAARFCEPSSANTMVPPMLVSEKSASSTSSGSPFVLRRSIGRSQQPSGVRSLSSSSSMASCASSTSSISTTDVDESPASASSRHDSLARATMFSSHNTPCGTPTYAAPEVLMRESYDPKVDMWSIGITMYVILVGRSPWSRPHEPQGIPLNIMASRIVRRDMTPCPSSVSENAVDLINQLTSFEASERPSLEEICDHPWFAETLPETVLMAIKKNSRSHINDDISEAQNADDTGGLPQRLADIPDSSSKNINSLSNAQEIAADMSAKP